VVAALGLAMLARRRPALRFVGRDLATRSTAPLLAAAASAVGVAVVAALWLPVWQWDALGYHLPYVNFALVARGFGAVPDNMPYVSTYPHNVERLIVALRAMLPDDRLVDVVQVPCALLGALATAGIARRVGAPRSTALAAGAAWMVVPAVFIQMPTDYVDIACVAFLLTAIYFVLSAASASRDEEKRSPAPRLLTSLFSSITARRLVMSGLALGIYLGTKPNSPLSASIVALMLLVVGWRSRERGALLLALLLVAIGAEPFVVNAVRHHNPVWPVRVQLGPIVLPGTESMQHLLESGAAAPHLHGSLLSRVARSWTSLTSPPVFDMRIGGFGPLVLAAMPAALVTLWRRRDRLALGALLATVAAPDPSVARYVMAFPALLLALAAPRAAALPPRVRPWLGLLAGAIGFWQIAYAWPGLTGDGPPLLAYAAMTDAQRADAVGANGPPTPFADARKRVGAGETFAFDQSLDLPYLAWEGDLRYRAVWIPRSLASAGEAEDFLQSENVRVVAAAEDSPVGEWLAQRPERFLKLFQCKSAPCSVFAR
ncbi:MAG TPA: hypothetical protein VH044_08375, partial [Polyangiaceae bacterium]|nr:hypothetical protein [Polyangiaceae bacterium]